MNKIFHPIIGIARQNNSGGYFIDNEDVSVFVAVEGHGKKDAYNRFKSIVAPYSFFCPCCGERWKGLDYNGWPAPEEGLTVENFVETENGEEVNCILYLLDGTKKSCKFIC